MPTGGRAPWSDARRERRDRPGSAYAAGSRASWRADGCSAGTCACSLWMPSVFCRRQTPLWPSSRSENDEIVKDTRCNSPHQNAPASGCDSDQRSRRTPRPKGHPRGTKRSNCPSGLAPHLVQPQPADRTAVEPVWTTLLACAVADPEWSIGSIAPFESRTKPTSCSFVRHVGDRPVRRPWPLAQGGCTGCGQPVDSGRLRGTRSVPKPGGTAGAGRGNRGGTKR